MLKAWDQISLTALLAALLALLFLGLFRLRWALPLKHIIGLTVATGFGYCLWFALFNIFALTALDFDFPIPVFPVSPEDMGCALVVGLVALLYWLAVSRRFNSSFGQGAKAAGTISARPEFSGWVCLLPALAALIVDVYFI